MADHGPGLSTSIRQPREALQTCSHGAPPTLARCAGPDSPVVRQRAVPAPKVVDTTGAGDCFTAAYAVAVLEGRPAAAALLFASAAASLCVQRPGAMPSLPSRSEVDALVASL